MTLQHLSLKTIILNAKSVRHYWFVLLAIAGFVSLANGQSVTPTWEPDNPNFILYTDPDFVKIGIGTDDPDALLEVQGDLDELALFTTKFSGGGKNSLLIGTDDDLQDFIRLRPVEGDGVAITNDGDDIGLFVDASNAFVGMGTSSPDKRLHIYEDGGTVEMRLESASTGGDTWLSLKNDAGHWQVGMSSTETYTVRDEESSVDVMLIETGADANSIYVNNSGQVGFGTDSPQYKVDVDGTLRATEIRVESSGADFVFEEDYQLMPLNELEASIKANKHLPGIPSAQDMQQNGVGVSELQTKLLQKVEELTLYILQQQKEIERLKATQVQ